MNEPDHANVTTDLPSAPVAPLGRVDALVTTDHESDSAGNEGLHVGAPAVELPAVPGYRVLREIARGGMGKVFAAHDFGLDREVALKVLLPGASADRFVRESKITARLPHPGIPPVHALGTLADGSPFLAMKLIAGQTLADEMKSADRPRLLQAFTQVCQAVGFAHSRGVIHRDLKPANVMVGAFGEVQVMDWGLAKDLTSQDVTDRRSSAQASPTAITAAEPGEPTDHRPAGESTDDQTHAGTVLGTPSYMAPEQARGEAADARSDVFALGGILCAILTGEPPFRGSSTREVIQRAGAADLAEANARLDGCGADAELVALCRRCLSSDPKDRPANGQAVADGLTAYLNGVQERLREAERERAVAVAREAEQRKRRRVQMALAAAVLLLLLGGAAVAWWQNEQANERRLADERAATELARMEGQQKADRAQRQLEDATRSAANAEAAAAHLNQLEQALRSGDAAMAQIALDAAMRRSAQGGAEKEAQRLDRLKSDLALLRELDKVDQFSWTWSMSRFPDPAEAAKRTREALRPFGADPDAPSLEEVAARVSASAVRERIIAALDQLLWQPKKPDRERARTVLQRVDADPFRDAVRDAFVVRDRRVVELAGQNAALEQPARFAAFLGDVDVIPLPRRRRLLQAALGRQPGDLVVLMTLGNITKEEPENECVRWYQAAVAVAPTNAAAHNNLGIALRAMERFAEAIASYRQAIALDPKMGVAHANLGFALDLAGKPKEAIDAWRAAVQLRPDMGNVHYWLAKGLLAQGRPGEAIKSLEEARKRLPPEATREFNLDAELARARRLAALEIRLPALLADKDHPTDNAERLELGELCRRQERFAAAARFCADAFAAEPNLADNLKAAHRYNAACSAALAADGKGQDSGKLDDKLCARLRKQTLDWLEADLAGLTKLLDSGPPQARPFIVQALTHWQKEPDLAGIRDKAALAKLPAQEQKAFTQFWADVAELLKEAETPAVKECK